MISPRYHREIPQRYRLEAGKCKGCGSVSFPPRIVCPECGKKITRIFSKDQEQIDSLVVEITGIENGLKKMLDNLRERIEKLRNERAELLKEINHLKIIGQKKANSLKKDINSLKEEIGSLREILE